MGDELAEVICLCCGCLCKACKALSENTECVKNILCCFCGFFSDCHSADAEKFIEHCCVGCCHCLECCATLCSQSTTNMNFQYAIVECGDAKKGVSVWALCAILLAVFLGGLGVVCLVTAYRFGDNHCEVPIDTHTVVQGIAMIGNAIVLIYIIVTYYLPADISLPLADKSVFPRFHGLFAKDIVLGILLGIVSLGFWWSLLGYYWLSGVKCDPADDYLLTMDSFAVGCEFMIVLGFLLGVYSILGIAACDEGSCRIEKLKLDCFLCCCGCCLKTPEDFKRQMDERIRRSRMDYPEHRNRCLNFSMGTLMICGCIRYKYNRSRLATEPLQDIPHGSVADNEIEEIRLPSEPTAQHIEVSIYPSSNISPFIEHNPLQISPNPPDILFEPTAQ